MHSALNLHLMQCSMEAFDTARQARSDFEEIFKTLPDVVGFTEVGGTDLRNELAMSAGARGYRVVGGRGDTALAVRGGHEIREQGSVRLHEGGRDEFGPYGPRYLDWVQAEIDGEVVTVSEAHWVRPKTSERRRKHRISTEAALRLAKDKSTGRDLAFTMGDLNEDDSPTERPGSAGARFDAEGITTIWDELGVYPATGPGGGTIDLIASVDADRRVTAAGVHVHRLLNADHHRISGFYTIQHRA